MRTDGGGRFDGTLTAMARRAADVTAVLVPGSGDQRADRRAVVAVFERHGEIDAGTLEIADVEPLRAVAIRLHAVFAAAGAGEAARLLNELLRESAGPPRLTCHDGSPWHLHVDASDDGPWAEWLAASSALALATLLAERQEKPGGLCASASCRRPFASVGRGVAQRYCSARCAGRERAAAHRARRRSAG